MGHVALYDPKLVALSDMVLPSLVARLRLKGYPTTEHAGQDTCLQCKKLVKTCTRTCSQCGGNICDACCAKSMTHDTNGGCAPNKERAREGDVAYMAINCSICRAERSIVLPVVLKDADHEPATQQVN